MIPQCEQQSFEDLKAIELARHIVDEVTTRGTSDTILLDIRGLTVIADYFVVTSVSSSPQMRAVRDALDHEVAKFVGRNPKIEGERSDAWVLADFGDVVVHLFSEEGRSHFRIEEFWDEAPIVLHVQ
jgi:ribosome-associated protein